MSQSNESRTTQNDTQPSQNDAKAWRRRCMDLCISCDVEGVVITFSKSGNIFGCGHPSVDFVVDRYLALQADVDNGSQELARGDDVIEISHEDGALTATEVEKMICEATVKDLGMSELAELEATVKEIKEKAAARAGEVAVKEIKKKEEARAREEAESGKPRNIRGKILEAEFGWGN